MAEIKYDVKRGADIYRVIYISRLKRWILDGYIKREEVFVWRSGLSGWRRPEELEELAPFFAERGRRQLRKAERLKKRRFVKKKKKKKKIKNILIIDDEEDLCSFLSDALNRRGYNVATANTGREGLVSSKKETPDLIFLDLKLSDGDGMKLLPKIKKVNPEIIVNVISAYGNEEIKEEARKRGAYRFIDKPFIQEDILRSIKAVS